MTWWFGNPHVEEGLNIPTLLQTGCDALEKKELFSHFFPQHDKVQLYHATDDDCPNDLFFHMNVRKVPPAALWHEDTWAADVNQPTTADHASFWD